jgi:bleomycin hydrolase
MPNFSNESYNMTRKTFIFLLFFLPVISLAQQPKDSGVFIEQKPGYYQNYILKGIQEFENPVLPKEARKYFTTDQTGMKLPNDLKLYTSYWRQAPVSQGATGTCWSFGSTSMMESEINRINGLSVKLSEMYTVYWEYVERAKAFVQNRGELYFEEGSEAIALPKIMKLYGAVPYQAYSGMLPGQKVHDHSKMVEEMKSYLQSVKKANLWDEATVVATICSILDAHMGKPPVSFTFEGKTFTPPSFLKDYCKVDPYDYYSFMSTMSQIYNQKGELVEDDNWWHCRDYYNVSLDDFMTIIKNSIKNGYTSCLCGDVSEPGYDRNTQCGIIPTFDIPSASIDENARELRFTNATTTDDHCMHLVGYYIRDGKFWYLLKDSGSGGWDGPNRGYRFVSEDYVKMKMMNILIYKEGARGVLDKIIK